MDTEKTQLSLVRLNQGRTTGWGIMCPDHGPLGNRKGHKKGAVAVAGEHVNKAHPEGATLREI